MRGRVHTTPNVIECERSFNHARMRHPVPASACVHVYVRECVCVRLRLYEVSVSV